MALLAPGTELSLVPVVLPMTGNAGRRQLVAVKVSAMAGVALHRRMRASQRIPRVSVVIEANRVPFSFAVTAFAPGSVASIVDILNPVTAHARGAYPLVMLSAVARGTGDGSVRLAEREFRRVMVEGFNFVPLCLTVTLFACFAEAPLVRLTVLVAIDAARGSVAEFYRLRMAVAAWNGDVGIPQSEVRECVIEGFSVKLYDISVPPHVIAVTMVAILLRSVRPASMKSLTG